MKTAPSALITFINASNVFRCADLYDIFLLNGDNLRYTDAEHPITYPATLTVVPPGTFVPVVGFKRPGVEWYSTPEVQSLNLQMLVNETILYAGRPISQAAHEGVFDAAIFKIYRAFLTADGKLVDALLHYVGTVGDVEPTSTEIRFVVKSELDKLNVQLPRNLYQPMCDHIFLDKGCDPGGTLRTASTTTGALVGTPTRFVLPISGSFAADNWKLGAIAITSGKCTGLRRSIRSDVDAGGHHELTLAVPLPSAPLAGDTYSLIVGCDRLFTTCTTRFTNTSHFRGFPSIPRPEEMWR